MALAEVRDSEPAPLLEDTWSAGNDSGTGCNVGVLMVVEVVVKTDVGPEDMSLQTSNEALHLWFFCYMRLRKTLLKYTLELFNSFRTCSDPELLLIFLRLQQQIGDGRGPAAAQ